MKTRYVALIALVAVGMFSVAAVAQDECMSAVAPGTAVDTCTMTDNPGDPVGSCWTGFTPFWTAWYSFTATDTQARVRTDLNSAGTDSSFAVYSGDCSNLVEIGCSEDEGAGFLGDICVTGLTVGNTYIVELTNWSTGTCGEYVVDVQTKADTCGNGVLDSPCEQCESDADCGPNEACGSDCKCFLAIPMLPKWGLVGLGLLLLAGGAMVFGRRRAVA